MGGPNLLENLRNTAGMLFLAAWNCITWHQVLSWPRWLRRHFHHFIIARRFLSCRDCVQLYWRVDLFRLVQTVCAVCRSYWVWIGFRQHGLGLSGWDFSWLIIRSLYYTVPVFRVYLIISLHVWFQACTEVNLCYESNNVTDMFPPMAFTEKDRRQYCVKRWGVVPNPKWLKVQFWGDGKRDGWRIQPN